MSIEDSPTSPARVVLIGPSGSGKSTLAARLAERLRYDVVDTDAVIVERIGMPIARFFERFGEPAFRAIETQVVAESVRRERVVIATGGGAVLSEANWVAWRPGSVILALEADAETLVERVRSQAQAAGDTTERPLLAGDALSKMQAMLTIREPLYQRADAVIRTQGVDVSAVEEQAVSACTLAAGRVLIPRLSLGSPTGRSDIYIGRGVRRAVPDLIRRRWPSARRVWIISDDAVAAQWMGDVQPFFAAAGYDVRDVVVPAGEASKSMVVVGQVCDALTTGGVSRRDVVLALGGGVVGDLAGFVAAICLRGLALVQLPTSLLAMVDSSVGGKTGVNNAAGKNMIGAFYQPGIVAVDPDFLATLPRDEYRSGMAEVIKHGVIQPSTPLGGDDLWTLLVSLSNIDPIPEEAIEAVLEMNIATKHAVVIADERETGLRMILNLGHTAGHAIEADGYQYRHGEAVGLGMLVASEIAERLGLVSPARGEEVAGLLLRAGLPTTVRGETATILSNMARDKKAVDGALTWILPVEAGGVEITRGVPADVVVEALRSIGAA